MPDSHDYLVINDLARHGGWLNGLGRNLCVDHGPPF
jgi:hypothetical protein